MKTLIVGAGPLGSLYACLFHKAGIDVTILARNEHYTYLEENGVILINEFTQEKIIERVKVIETITEKDEYDLVIVLIRKNRVKNHRAHRLRRPPCNRRRLKSWVFPLNKP